MEVVKIILTVYIEHIDSRANSISTELKCDMGIKREVS